MTTPPKPFDPSKPVQTRSGRKARIMCVNTGGPRPILALVENADGSEYPTLTNNDGRIWDCDSPDDLANIPLEPERFEFLMSVTVYRAPTGRILPAMDWHSDTELPKILGSVIVTVRGEIDPETGKVKTI